MIFKLCIGDLGPVLQAYTEDRGRVAIIRGPLGSGKTVGSCQTIMQRMCEQRPNSLGQRKSRWIAIRNTFPDLQTTTIKDWLGLFEELGTFKGGGIAPPCHTLHFRLPDKTVVMAELIFIALDRPQAIKKLRGTQVTGFWLNEIKELDKSIIDMADLRHGRYPSPLDGGPSWHGMIGDTNSPDDDHWLYEMAEETKPEGWSFYVQPGGLMREMIEVDGAQEWTGKWIANPDAENLQNLPKDYYLTGQEGKSTDWIQVNLANEYGSVHDGKAIYAEQWNDALHVSESIYLVDDETVYVGLDFGLTPSAILGQVTPRGNLNILEELVAEGMGIKQFAEEVLLPKLALEYPDNDYVFVGDPSGNKRAETDEVTVFKELYDLGIDCEPANTNDPSIRWEAVRFFLTALRDGKPAFRLHPRCKQLRKGFNGGYRLRKLQVAGTSKFSEKADKNKYSHPHDGLQYLAMRVKGTMKAPSTGFKRPSDNDRWTN